MLRRSPLERSSETSKTPTAEPPWQVGLVRQTETAAVKTAGGTRGPFERAVSALYTAATLDAQPVEAFSSAGGGWGGGGGGQRGGGSAWE